MHDEVLALRAARRQLAAALATIDDWIRRSGGKRPAAAARAAAGADRVAAFMAECTTSKKSATVQARVLHDVYVLWCRSNGIDQLGPRSFGLRLAELGYPKGKAGFHFYLGLEFARAGQELFRDMRRGGQRSAAQPARRSES